MQSSTNATTRPPAFQHSTSSSPSRPLSPADLAPADGRPATPLPIPRQHDPAFALKKSVRGRQVGLGSTVDGPRRARTRQPVKPNPRPAPARPAPALAPPPFLASSTHALTLTRLKTALCDQSQVQVQRQLTLLDKAVGGLATQHEARDWLLDELLPLLGPAALVLFGRSLGAILGGSQIPAACARSLAGRLLAVPAPLAEDALEALARSLEQAQVLPPAPADGQAFTQFGALFLRGIGGLDGEAYRGALARLVRSFGEGDARAARIGAMQDALRWPSLAEHARDHLQDAAHALVQGLGAARLAAAPTWKELIALLRGLIAPLGPGQAVAALRGVAGALGAAGQSAADQDRLFDTVAEAAEPLGTGTLAEAVGGLLQMLGSADSVRAVGLRGLQRMLAAGAAPESAHEVLAGIVLAQQAFPAGLAAPPA